MIIRLCRLRLDRKDISAIFIMLEVIKKALMTQNNLITIVTMWNKVNELSRENLPQQQIVTSSFHQCQQGSTSSQCQCYSSNILVNANPSHPPSHTITQSHSTKSLIHHPPKKRSHQGSAYPNIKHYRTIASLIHATIYRTSSSVT